jgi:hypothetical protein
VNPKDTLLFAIEDAYAVFSTYQRPVKLFASPTRDANEILSTLSAAPLRELTGEQIGPYSGWALTTVGTVEDYKHFLPRILEQAVRRPDWMGTEPAIIAERLKMADWRSWPAKEQVAIRKVFHAAWMQLSAKDPASSGDASEWLCGIAVLGDDLSQLLANWLSQPSPNAIIQAASFAPTVAKFSTESPDDLAFWTYAGREARDEVANWFYSVATRMTFLSALNSVADDDRWILERAVEALGFVTTPSSASIH